MLSDGEASNVQGLKKKQFHAGFLFYFGTTFYIKNI
jgi:hypothetical protein